ncbi:MAG: trehalose-6-phosphate synthase [Bdellovibrionales bacterium GWA2_49_15]|nr:MAG: trehalose-6-phosphate synthase [Bdellovibrionales bacterium GWA2_49_15]HAZ14671.1 trehalose-6-phosphate synthase [Bdellovibrionales bacterium]
MKFSLRFILPLIIVLGSIAYGLVPLVDMLTLKWFVRDLEMRSRLITNTMNEPLAQLILTKSTSKVTNFLNRAIQDERLFALGFCDEQNTLRFKTPTFPIALQCDNQELKNEGRGDLVSESKGLLHVAVHPVESEGQHIGRLVIVHDMSFIERRSGDTKKYVFYLFAGLAAVISLLTVVIAQLSFRGLVSGIRALVKGEGLLPLSQIKSRELLPLAKDLRALVRDLEQDRRVKDEAQLTWNPQTLKNILHEDLAGDEVLIVSNREPYIHVRRGDQIEVQVPASGLVTALEPIMRACSGTWIAHGSGSADRDVVDKKDHIRVPPEQPVYQIRRVWLSKEQEAGYYYGFANEGLWPLCHIAHTRPTFRSSDWKQYVEVNEKFAKAVIEEAKTDDPVILVQDYHFALLPKLIREKLPNATIITFWHIPWPNPEAFAICPWREEILAGLLGSSIIGFHTRFHCNNFIDTVDRFLEARINRETSTISHGGKLAAVRSYPISIEWPPVWLKKQKSIADCRKDIRTINNADQERLLGIGIDRLDYTKGIIERFMAVERLLELHPELIGKFTFIQIAAPSRSSIEQYQHFEAQVRSLATQINQRFGSEGYQPICLKIEHHTPEQVFKYYRAADVCMVTSLHDGMNLVAKEFVAARDDERGVLILSQFTGASRELLEALVVNPYNIDQCASALQVALAMPVNEQKDRMRSMRGLIQEFNVYRWAGRMLMDAARMRQRQRLLGRIRLSESSLQEGTEL